VVEGYRIAPLSEDSTAIQIQASQATGNAPRAMIIDARAGATNNVPLMRSRPPLVLFSLLILIPLAALGGWWGVTWIRESPLREAQAALRTGRHLEAAGIAEACLADRPGDQRAMLAAARAYAHLGRWDLAEAYFAAVPLRELDDLHLRARGLIVRQLHDKAADVFEQILQRWPMDGESLQRLAAIRGQQLRVPEALVFARRLCQVPSHRVVGHVLTGMLQMQARDPARAVEALEAALQLSPAASRPDQRRGAIRHPSP
jgi:tetratricopeptide (TPR) repeat protein